MTLASAARDIQDMALDTTVSSPGFSISLSRHVILATRCRSTRFIDHSMLTLCFAELTAPYLKAFLLSSRICSSFHLL